MKTVIQSLSLIGVLLLLSWGSLRNEELARNYLGFDRNRFPEEETLAALRKTFSFTGYWLNNPPGETTNTWLGKRKLLFEKGFGFLVLFNGRSYKQLTASADPSVLGRQDASSAAEIARREGFPIGTVIYLDLEEGGRLLPEQRAYVHAWIDGVNGSGFRAGVYCSGMPATEASGDAVITAQDLREQAGKRQIVFWIYNDACPPSPGCAFPKNAPAPSKSGIAFAEVWQYTQSPQRKSIAASCPNNYASDGNCYAPTAAGLPPPCVDLDAATSPDPSHGRGNSQ
jgi:hypothetical protein